MPLFQSFNFFLATRILFFLQVWILQVRIGNPQQLNTLVYHFVFTVGEFSNETVYLLKKTQIIFANYCKSFKDQLLKTRGSYVT